MITYKISHLPVIGAGGLAPGNRPCLDCSRRAGSGRTVYPAEAPRAAKDLGTPIHSGERSLRPYGEIEVRPKHNHIGIHDQLCATAVQQDLEMAARERLAADRGLLGWYFDILGSLGSLIF